MFPGAIYKCFLLLVFKKEVLASFPSPSMIADEVRRRFLRGVGVNVYGQLVTIVVQLLGVPILLTAWGAPVYGQWLTLFVLPGYLSMTDFGFSISAANDMTAMVARGNFAQAQSVFQSINLLILITGVTAGVGAGLLIYKLPIERWLTLGALTPGSIRLVLLLLCGDILMKLLDGINHAGFRANGEFAIHAAIANTTPLLQQSAIWALALSGRGPVDAAAAYAGIRFIVVPATAIFLSLRHRWLKFGFRQARPRELRRLLSPAVANLALPLAGAMNIQGMVLVVAFVLGPVAVVVFSTTRTFTRLTVQLVSTISFAAEPEFARFGRHLAHNGLGFFYAQIIRLSVWTALLPVIGSAIFGRTLLSHWTRGQVAVNSALLGWLLATAVTQSVWHGSLGMLKALNAHISAAIGQVVVALAAVAAAFALLSASGEVSNAGLALFATDFLFMIYTMRIVANVTGINIGHTLLAAFDPRPLWLFIYPHSATRGR